MGEGHHVILLDPAHLASFLAQRIHLPILHMNLSCCSRRVLSVNAGREPEAKVEVDKD